VIGLLTALHVLVAVILILAVLLQSARGADLAGAFGGMGSQTAFGPRGTATFLSKATVVLAVVFMLTSITLAVMGNQFRGTGGPSVLGDELGSEPTTPVPSGETATPPAPGTAPGISVTLPGEGETGTEQPAGTPPAQPAEPAPATPPPSAPGAPPAP